MTRAVTINQASITRAIKAVEKSGVDKVIKVCRDGSVLILPPCMVDTGTPINDFDVDTKDKYDL